MTYRDFIEKAGSETGWIIAAYTDKYILDKWPMSASEQEGYVKAPEAERKALEVRIFNKDRELLISRSDIGKEFVYREINDNSSETRDTFDEVQYLDIDTSKGHDNSYVFATGGGRYYLPVDRINDARIKIRYYVDRYPGTGQARVSDWRVVELMEGK